MPIIDIQVVSPPEEALPEGMAKQLARSLGDVLESPAGTLWVRLEVLPRSHYAENQQPSPDPVFVTLLLADLPEADVMARRAVDIASAVASLLHRPEGNVHVLFEPAARGRIAFGGKLLR